ncbi:phosphate transport system permease protein PstA [Asanoa ishikariensis]|uniref:Phosphate transport system permease protein PstA n=1 Tax=Asanoa ishikariensis TaxID=137265 RepID=A0A1H3R5Y5_9ACTN|nr:phosphate ABC transporter permease PstA [Asanoa ishikariensis]GIF64372.1 phosphate transport system permease protein PstA [Asanoa ishikariensis]SDZ21194.1 phosphate ABC transporter membrane protein 2, PhoT family [Asanoa ishikariensis]
MTTTIEPRTTLPERAADAGHEVRRSTGSTRKADLYVALGAAWGSLALTALLFTRLAPFDGTLGFVVLAFVFFVAFYGLLVGLDERGPTVRDRIAAVLVHGLAVLMLIALVVVVVFTVYRGLDALGHRNFYTQDMRDAGPLQPLSIGGIRHAILGTLEQISIALAVTVPLGVTAAVFLAELPGRFSRFVRTIVEAMTALPSVVAGLFVYSSVILLLNQAKDRLPEELRWLAVGKSGFAASLAISVMMLPIVIRAADVVIRLVPGTLREASLALGGSQWRTVWYVVLPTARSGLMTAIILGTARGIGETSPVLLTSGVTAYTNANPMREPQISLPLFVFNSVTRPDAGMISRGFGAAAVLMFLVLFLFAVARIIGGRPAGQLGRGQRRRRAGRSYRDAVRFAGRERARVTNRDDEVST